MSSLCKAATFSVPFSFLCLIPNTSETQFPPLVGTVTLKIAGSNVNTEKNHFSCFKYAVSNQNHVHAKAEIHSLLELHRGFFFPEPSCAHAAHWPLSPKPLVNLAVPFVSNLSLPLPLLKNV